MKSTCFKQLLFTVIILFASTITRAQVAAVEICNVSNCIILHPADGSGYIMIAPKLPGTLNSVSWAHITPGDTDLAHVIWLEATCAPADDTTPILALVNKDGLGNEDKFYIIYSDNTLAIATATSTGISTPVTISHQAYGFYKLAGKTNLYMVETNGYIYKSTDGGQNWVADTVNVGAGGFVDVGVDNFENVYGLYNSEVYKQQSNSSAWRLVTTLPGGQIPNALFTDRRGYLFVGTYGNGIYCSKDTGNTFVRSATTVNGAIALQFCDDAFGNVYMLANGNKLYRSTDTGTTWVSVGIPITSLEKDSGNFTIINNIAADSVLTAATIYGMFASHNQGNTWITINQHQHEIMFTGFYKTPAGRFIESSSNGLFYKDPDNNAFTNSLPGTGYSFTGPIYADTLGHIYTSSHANNNANAASTFWQSNNYGNTWQADTQGLSVMRSPNTFGIDEYGSMHVAANGLFGKIWLYTKTAGGSFVIDTAGMGNSVGPYYTVNAIASDNDGSLFMAGGGNASRNICWRRPVNGGTWVLDTAGLPWITVIQQLTHENNHDMVALTGSIYYHHAGRWVEVPLPQAPANGYAAAVAADNTGGIIIAYTDPITNNSYGVYCTHNHGATWDFVGLQGTYIYSLYNFADTTYAITDRGIYPLTCNGVSINPTAINAAGISPACNMALYPNPAHGECNVTLTQPAVTKSELSIIDMNGRLLKNIAIPAGVSSLNFNTANISSGTYFCVLKASNGVIEVRKLVVIK